MVKNNDTKIHYTKHQFTKVLEGKRERERESERRGREGGREQRERCWGAS